MIETRKVRCERCAGMDLTWHRHPWEPLPCFEPRKDWRSGMRWFFDRARWFVAKRFVGRGP